MGLRIFLRIENEFAAMTEFGTVLEYFCRSENEFAAKTKFGIVLEYFCRIEVGLFFVQEEREEEMD